MQANIANLTISEPAFVRLYIDVQSEGITQEIVQDLPSMVQVCSHVSFSLTC